MHLKRARPKAAELVENLVSGLGPPKRLRVVIMRGDVGQDGVSQLRHARVRPALERAFGEYRKEPLHQSEPRAIRRREVELKPGMP